MQKMRKMSAALGRVVLCAAIVVCVFMYTGGGNLLEYMPRSIHILAIR